MNINDAITTSAISHVPAFRMNLTEIQGIFGAMRRMRNISLLCCCQHVKAVKVETANVSLLRVLKMNARDILVVAVQIFENDLVYPANDNAFFLDKNQTQIQSLFPNKITQQLITTELPFCKKCIHNFFTVLH